MRHPRPTAATAYTFSHSTEFSIYVEMERQLRARAWWRPARRKTTMSGGHRAARGPPRGQRGRGPRRVEQLFDCFCDFGAVVDDAAAVVDAAADSGRISPKGGAF
eukprot:gene45336-29292_t